MLSFNKKLLLWLLPLLFLLLAGLYLPYSSYFGVPVLNYHQVNPEGKGALTLSPQEFEEQMAYLKKAGYTAITPRQLIDYLKDGAKLPPNPILITFDDGYVDNYVFAYPLLQKYNFTATIFVVTDFPDNDKHYLTWAQIKEMQENGMTFASHTLSHVVLTEQSDDNLRAQLVISREALEYRLGKKIEALAYPGGFYDKRIIAAAKEAGYQAAFTINLGRAQKDSNLFALSRIPIFKSTSNTYLHFWLRLKLTEEMLALENLKSSLKNKGATWLASFVPTF